MWIVPSVYWRVNVFRRVFCWFDSVFDEKTVHLIGLVNEALFTYIDIMIFKPLLFILFRYVKITLWLVPNRRLPLGIENLVHSSRNDVTAASLLFAVLGGQLTQSNHTLVRARIQTVGATLLIAGILFLVENNVVALLWALRIRVLDVRVRELIGVLVLAGGEGLTIASLYRVCNGCPRCACIEWDLKMNCGWRQFVAATKLLSQFAIIIEVLVVKSNFHSVIPRVLKWVDRQVRRRLVIFHHFLWSLQSAHSLAAFLMLIIVNGGMWQVAAISVIYFSTHSTN